MPRKKKEETRPNLTRAQAIREFCIECMGYEVREVNKCPAEPCPLWPYRKGKGKDETTALLLKQRK